MKPTQGVELGDRVVSRRPISLNLELEQEQ